MLNPVLELMTRACVIEHVTYGEPDVYGDRTRTVVEHPTVCELQQSTSSETRDGATVVTEVWNLYLPPGTPISPADEVTVDGYSGVVFTVDSQPWAVRDALSDIESHVEAVLRVVS